LFALVGLSLEVLLITAAKIGKTAFAMLMPAVFRKERYRIKAKMFVFSLKY
jgi:DNA-binding MltR family transcriptional regulator